MIAQVLLAVLVIAFLALRWKTRKVRAVAKLLKTDKTALPLLGISHHFMGGGEVRMQTIKELSYTAIKYGGWTCAQLGPLWYGVVADAIEAEHIFKYHIEKDDAVKVARSLVGDALVFAPVSIWRPRRKLLAPTFNQHNLNQFVNVFQKQSNIMVENLGEVACGQDFSIWKYLTAYAMDSVCQTTLGIDIGIQKTPGHQFMKSFQEFADITAYRIFAPWLRTTLGFKMIAYNSYLKSHAAITYLQNFVNDIIDKKRGAFNKQKEAEQLNGAPNNEGNAKNMFRPVLELLIEGAGDEKSENMYTNTELREESLVVVLAGTDTSAVGMAFLTLMLAKHPDIQEKVYKEIYEVYGDTDRQVVAEDLSRLVYLEAVIKEALRLYPPVPIIARKVVKDDVTPGGIKLAKGMGIVITHFGIHRNKKYWGEDAEEFRPERFFDSPPTHPAAFVPFAYGPRNCLGYKYAMMSLKTVATTLLRKYRLLPSDSQTDTPLRLSFEVMLKNVDNFQVKLAPRNPKSSTETVTPTAGA